MKKSYVVLFIILLIASLIFGAAAGALWFLLPKTQDGATATPSQAARMKATPDAAETSSDGIPHGPAAPDRTPATEASAVPDEMAEILAQCGSSAQALSDLDCRQLVTVKSSENTATVKFYELQNGVWVPDETLSCSGYVGLNGVTEDMQEGSMATPKGLYRVGEAFYINDKPETGLNSFRITQDTYWVDDPDSAFYNQRVEGTAERDWNSAEHLIDYDVYRYGFVIEYNTEAEYNKGSATFFHISNGNSAGCVGVEEQYVLRYLAALDAEQNPYIVMV